MWEIFHFPIVSCISVLLHVQGYHITPSQVSLSPHSSAIMSCAQSVKQWMVACQSCVAEVDSIVCHSSWRMLVMHLPRRRAMKCVKSWMGKKTAHVILTLNSIINCDFALRICIILICSTPVLYNTVTQSHHVVNKMDNDKSILAWEIYSPSHHYWNPFFFFV